MSDHPFVAVAFVAYLVAVAGTGPLVAVAFVLHRLGRVGPFHRALVAAATLPLVGLATLTAWVGVEVAPLAAFDVAVRALPTWFVCWVPPLLLAYGVGRRLGHPSERALRRSAAGLPVGLLGSFAVFVAPGGALRYNITFLEGTEALLWWSAFGLVILVLPAVLVTVVTVAERRR